MPKRQHELTTREAEKCSLFCKSDKVTASEDPLLGEGSKKLYVEEELIDKEQLSSSSQNGNSNSESEDSPSSQSSKRESQCLSALSAVIDTISEVDSSFEENHCRQNISGDTIPTCINVVGENQDRHEVSDKADLIVGDGLATLSNDAPDDSDEQRLTLSEQMDGHDRSGKNVSENQDGNDAFSEVAKKGTSGFLMSGSHIVDSENCNFTSIESSLPFEESVDGDHVHRGEEDELEVFSATSVTIFKSIEIESNKDDQNGTRYDRRFVKQGEGHLRILRPKDNLTGSSHPRIIMRQKGTWKVLLNNPIAASPKFETVAHMSSGFGLKFIALDRLVNPSNNESSDNAKPVFAAFCIKFTTESQRSQFLTAVDKWR